MTTEFRNATQKIDAKKLFKMYVKHVFLSLITLSWYRFFTRTEIRQYLWQSVEIDGEPFEYTGKGMDLLLGYLKAVAVMIVIYAGGFAILLFTSETIQVLCFLLGALVLYFLASVAYYGALRYRLSRTVHRGIHFGLRGSAWRFGLLGLKHGFLSVVTFGFYTPYAANENWAYIVGNMYFGDQPFAYDATRKVPLGSYVLAVFLTLFTLGASWFWYEATITRHCVNGMSLNDVRFRSTISGGRFLGFTLLNLVLLAISFGLLYPFIIKRSVKLFCETTAFSGELDFARVHQADVQVGAASEGFVEIFGTRVNHMEKYYYYDGKTAQGQIVNLSLLAQGVTITTNEGFRVGYWTFNDIDVVSDDLKTNCIRLSNQKLRGARLTVEGGIATRMRSSLEAAHKGRKGFRAQHLIFAVPMVVALFITGFTLYGPPVADMFLPYIPTSLDEKIGELAESQLVDDITLCGDEVAEAALNKIAKRLLEHVDSPFKFQIDIALDDTVNAFALPGGHIIIYGGLIDEAETPEELAGVMAHEMAHVIKRHGVGSLAKQLGLQALVFSATGDTSSVINFGHTLLSMSMSRSQESEADAVGSEILAKAGVSVKGLQTFFARIAKEHSDYGALNLLETHPHGDDRAEALKDPPGFVSRPLLTKKEWAALKKYCE